jgi:tRNA (cmo5U34)-methyltransferase
VQAQRWDVVVLIGVVYAFLDTYGLLEDVAEITDYAVIVDSIYPWNMTTAEVSIIDVIRAQHINSSDGATAYQGAGARPSPQALSIMMETLGFENREGLLYPEPITVEGQHDSYLQPIERPGSRSAAVPARYLARFYRTDASTLRPVTDSVVGAVKANQVPMARAPVIKNSGSWSFDAGVAQRFQREAECHIPDYQRVLDLSAEIVDRVYPGERGLGIVDVGSALGHTLKLFTDRGYVDVWGLESSPAMRDSSQLQDRVRLCSEFPKDRAWRVVLANWTLHFVQEREQYLQAIYDQLEPGGCLIISDKMSHGSLEEELYHEFKRGNGISEEEIAEKKARLVGVLTPRPLEWYLETLKRIGFTDLAVVNSRYMFHTIYARRY